MSIAIIGSGHVGSALARIFAKAGVQASIANSRGPKSIPLSTDQRAYITAVDLTRALDADVIFVAVPFGSIQALGGSLDDWSGRIVVDVSNAFGVDPEVFAEGTPSDLVAQWLPGAVVVKAMNHLPYAVFEAPVPAPGGRRAVFVSSNDTGASSRIAELATDLGFAPVELGSLHTGGRALVPGGALIFKNLIEYALP